MTDLSITISINVYFLTCNTFENQALCMNVEFCEGRRVRNGRVNRAETFEVVLSSIKIRNSSLQFHVRCGLDPLKYFVEESRCCFARLFTLNCRRPVEGWVTVGHEMRVGVDQVMVVPLCVLVQ